MDTNEDYLDSLLKSVTEPENNSEDVPIQESDLGLGEDLGLGSDLGLGEDLGLGNDLGLGEDLGLGTDLGLQEAFEFGDLDVTSDEASESIDEDFNLEEFLASEGDIVLDDLPTIEEPILEQEPEAEEIIEPELLDFAQADALLADIEKGVGESGVVREREAEPEVLEESVEEIVSTGDSWDTPVESVIKKQSTSIFDSIRQEMQLGDASQEDMILADTEPVETVEDMPQTEDVFGSDFFMDELGIEGIDTIDIPEVDMSGEALSMEEIPLSDGNEAALGMDEPFDFENADLADLLAGSSDLEDGSIQEISDLLEKDESNVAVDDDMMALLQSVSGLEGEEDSFDPLSFLAEEADGVEHAAPGGKKKAKKEKKPKKEKAPKPVKDGVEKEKKQGLFARLLSFLEEGEEDETDDLITSLQAENDAILKEMGGEDGAPDLLPEKKESEPEKEAEPDKKEQEKKEKQEQKEKAKKEKQEKKEQRKKEKEEKRERERQEAAGRPKFPMKKAVCIFVVCIMLMLAFLTVSNLLTSHSIKQKAIDAYYAGDYLQCYELLYGQDRADSEDVMYHRSEIQMKMQLERNRYDKYLTEGKELEAVDHYVQFLVDYADLYEYSLRWQAEDIMEDMYLHVTETLFSSYGLTESEALEINALRKDVDYTRALTKVIEGTFHEKPVEEPTGPVYEDLLPEEEARLGITGE